MASPVYKLFLVRPSEAWYQLSKEERDSLLAKLDEAREKVGCRQVLMCDSSWSSDQWLGFGVEEFRDIEAVQKYTELLNELDWFRYIESITVLGSEWKPHSTT